MNIAVRIFPPVIYPCVKESKSLRPTEMCPNPGIIAEILGGILENQMRLRLNLTFLQFRSGNSSLDMIRRGTVNTFAWAELIAPAYFDYSHPVVYISRGYITQRSKIVPKGDIFNSLSSETWIGILCVLLLCCAILSVRAVKFGSKNDLFWSLISLMTNHYNGDNQLTSSKGRLKYYINT